MKSAITRDLALAAFRKHLAIHKNFDHYTGIVTLHGLARLATETGDAGLIAETRRQFLPYVRGERPFKVNFPNYLCGGNGTAYFFWKGHLPEASDSVRRYADEILHDAVRDSHGILCHPNAPEQEKIWIDVAFAVTPFLLFAGLALQNESYIEEAYQQTARMVAIFRDPENGLLHQSKNFTGRLPGRISEDHWSRGNGWGIYALTELATQIPASHPRREESIRLYTDLVRACVAIQDEQGLWHQEMTEDLAYVETSGSALILYAIGAGLAAGVLDDSFRAPFEKGLSGLLAYISEDTDIYHTCRGCLCPGEGTKLDYMARSPLLNDHHAFGPVVLAMGQAHLLGIREVTA